MQDIDSLLSHAADEIRLGFIRQTKAPDKRSIEDNSKIIFHISQRKHIF